MEVFRIHPEIPVYYLTFTVVHWLPVFVSAEPCLIITESLNFCHQNKGLRTNAFVIMPTHMHLIAFDADFDNRRFSQALADMRKFTGQRLSDFCENKMPRVFGQVLQGARRTDRSRQFWQPSRHPEAIYSRDFWRIKVDYLHDNPRRKGLVHDVTHWRFSSAAYWLLDPPGEMDVVLTGIEW
jgi:putative transposase